MDNRHLIASDGMLLTDGEDYFVEVWLANWDSPDNWHEVSRAEYEAMQTDQPTRKEVSV